MADINKNLRFYQPNDPYQWQVDNLPLTDLLSNDIILEDRLKSLEDTFSGLGDNPKGSFGLGAIADLKAYTEPETGATSKFGKVFVRPGKFNARMPVAATRESGWRMMRDRSDVFTNESFAGTGDDVLSTTETSEDFVRSSAGASRTAVVEFYPDPDGKDQSAVIESFDPEEFIDASPPSERLDLVYIKPSQSLDTDLNKNGMPEASIGIVKGAYFRTDPAGGLQTTGRRFTDKNARSRGLTTGMADCEVPADARLAGFGTVPMPDDLVNFSWHPASTPLLGGPFGEEQVSTQAVFCLPVAYVRVPSWYVQGQPIPQSNVYDIRPFLRTAELTYSERAGIANSVDPHGNNPFITRKHLERGYLDAINNQLSTNTNNIASNTGRIDLNTASIDRIETDLYGLESQETTDSKNFEGRIIALENAQSTGGSSGGSTFGFLAAPYPFIEDALASEMGTYQNPKRWNITLAIPPGVASTLVAVQFRVLARHTGGDSGEGGLFFFVPTGISPNPFTTSPSNTAKEVVRTGINIDGGQATWGCFDSNTFYHDVYKWRSSTGGAWQLEFATYTDNPTDPKLRFSIYIDGYIA